MKITAATFGPTCRPRPAAVTNGQSFSGRSSYAAAKRGDIPVIKVGRRLLVPVGRLKQLFGETA